ncbi:MAG: alkaline phosphatase family protein [Chloroflexi bacterium]|nr:alkaline phosphatase family protein [Chloroflexota bacterium]
MLQAAVLTHLNICLDGVGPDYLAVAHTPTLDALGQRGWRTIGLGVMPSVTNVNNVSMVTGGPSALHGITSNFYLDPASGQSVYMESADFILAPTIFERAARHGRRSAVITAKDKLRTLIARGASEVISAESPPAWLVDAIGAPPPILSLEVNHWLFRAAAAVCRANPPDLLYLTTTDYAQHKFAPEAAVAQANLATLDSLLADILNSGPEFAVVAAADHGMRAKRRGLDLGQILSNAHIAADAVPIIKDRYVAHHQNLGGAAYIYLEHLAQLDKARALLRAEPGVESVWTQAEAAAAFQLHPDRIGHLFVLAAEETVFGALPSPRETVSVRSHGCLHTRSVPIIASGPGVPREPFTHNYQMASWIQW